MVTSVLPDDRRMSAEVRISGRATLPRTASMVFALAASGAFAQPTPAVSLGGAVGLTISASDNQRLDRSDGTADLVIQPQLTLRLAARGGVVRGDVDYTLGSLVYTRDSEGDSLQNTLAAGLVASPPGEDWAIAADASISQQPRSAFSRYADGPGIGRESDRTELRTLQVAPSLQGRLGGGYVWNGRLALRATRSTDDASAAVDTFSGRLRVSADGAGARFVPSLSANGNVYDFQSGRRTSQAELIGAVTAAVDLDLRVGVQAGVETNNFRTAERETSPLWGVTLGWEPGARTRLDIAAQRRDVSNSHDVSFQHRFARSAVQFRDARSVAAPDASLTPVGIGTAYDVLFLQFASLEPDTEKRKTLVEAYLRLNNIDPRRPVLANFLTNSLLEQRVQTLAFSWTGLRDSATLALSRTASQRIDDFVAPAGGDGFSSSERLRQSGLSLGLSHRLTPLATLGLDMSIQRTSDEAGRSSALRAIGLLWSSRVNPSLAVSVGARHVENRSTLDPYEATVVTTTARLEF
jgi:uncharacterized protein (PEP-CTERM system associated)